MTANEGVRRVGTVAACLFLAASAAQAQNVLFVDVDAGGTGDGTSWVDAYTDLQGALLDAAGSSGAVTEVWVAAGTYQPAGAGGSRAATFQLLDGLAIYGGFAGTENPGTFDLDDRDFIANQAFLSGDLNGDDGPGFLNNSENSYHVVTGTYTDSSARLDGFTITGGNANSSSSPNGFGGGMLNWRLSGGLPSSGPVVANCNFDGNFAKYGGGLIVGNGSIVSLFNCTFSNNLGESQGGGVYSNSTTTATVMTNCIFRANSSRTGGGMYVRAQALLTNCLFTGNEATDVSPPSTNLSIGGGGGLYTIAVVSNLRLNNCTFGGNLAKRGGAIHASYSGAVGSSPIITNCVLWGNSASEAGNEFIRYGSSFPWFSFCDIEGSGGSGGGWDSALGTDNGDNIDVDPLFVDADGADDVPGTEDDDFRLLAGSPCIDAGDDSAVPGSVTTDLDGQPRIRCEAVDMGAYESGSGTGGAEIACPPDVTVGCNESTDPANTGQATAIDGCSGAPVPTIYGDNSVSDCGSTQTITRTWTADDGSVSPAFCDQAITTVDAVAPSLTVPSDATVECDADSSPVATGSATAVDDCDVAPVITFADGATAGACPDESVITRTWTATDGCDNSAAADQLVSVVDSTPPVLVVDTTPITAVDSDCTGDEAVTLPEAAATDNCAVAVTVSDDAPALFPAGETTTVTFTAADECGNSASDAVDATVKYGATVRVLVHELHFGWGSHPGVSRVPLVGVTVYAYGRVDGEYCSHYQEGWRGWDWWRHVVNECDESPEVNSAVTDEDGVALIDVPPGDYLLVAYFDLDEDGENDHYVGRQARSVICGETLTRRLRLLVTPRGKRLPAKIRRLTGSELIIAEPDMMIWDEEDQEYPFAFESAGDWGVTVTVEPPEGFVPDEGSLSTNVDDTLEAVQFTITEVGSDLVPTRTRIEVTHNGRRQVLRSRVGIRLTPDYAVSRGFNLRELRSRGLIEEKRPARHNRVRNGVRR